MASTLLPFLYQTRTLHRLVRNQNVVQSVRFAYTHRRSDGGKQDNSIPFEWDDDTPYEGASDALDKTPTMTPAEAKVFKGIFDEIAQGRMPAAKKRSTASKATPRPSVTEQPSADQAQGMARSIVDQAREMKFREKILSRYPPSLRDAAQIALGLYQLEPNPKNGTASQMIEFEEADGAKREQRAKYEHARAEERERVDSLMKACETDAQLWGVMENEVFSLPARLGIAQRTRCNRKKASVRKYTAASEAESTSTATDDEQLLAKLGIEAQDTNGKSQKKTVRERTAASKAESTSTATDDEQLLAKLGIETQDTNGKSQKKTVRKRTAASKAESTLDSSTAADENRVMDVHGPLYPHFINHGLTLFHTAFSRPSDYAFGILPRIKQLGLPSYVLGVSSIFYARLARMHWNRFGDAASALDLLEEMNSAGLYPNEDVHKLLAMMLDHLHGCTWGAQGSFVMGMMEAPPYDATLTQRLEDMKKFASQSMKTTSSGI